MFGFIVNMPTVSVPEGVAKFLLIDGQQRLTTGFILLSLLRNEARESQGAFLLPPQPKQKDVHCGGSGGRRHGGGTLGPFRYALSATIIAESRGAKRKTEKRKGVPKVPLVKNDDID